MLFFSLAVWCASALASAPQPLRTLSAIHQLSNAEADRALPTDFEAIVTYYRASNRDLFVQDGDAAIFVHSPLNLNLVPGDRIRVRGTTRGSFRPYIESKNIQVIGHGDLPKPLRATFAEMIRGETDCRLITVRAVIRSADIVPGSNMLEPTTYLQMLVDGEPIDANVDSADENALKDLLDAEVEITGAVSGHFDNKMQLTGILFHIQNLAYVKVLKRANSDPWSLPITPMDGVITGFRVRNLGERMRVHGSITYYQAGAALVLQDGSKSLWIATQSYRPLKIGDLADVVGFTEVQNGFLRLSRAEVRDSGTQAPIMPSSYTWRDLAMGGNQGRSHIFDLVSIDGKVVTEVRQATQDEYVLETGGHLFSAILRHHNSAIGATPLSAMKEVPPGSAVRVTGICMLDDANPFNGDVPFNILMRSVDDIAVVARPSMLNVGNLIRIVTVLLVIVAAVCAWVWMLRRKLQRQAAELATRIEAEAILERKRSRILEEINGTQPLTEILQRITELVSFRLSGAPCWCEIGDSLKLGNIPPQPGQPEIIRHEIPSRSGTLHGILFAAIDSLAPPCAHAQEALSMGAWLATMAIETRGLYSDLVHRSEFDLLTDIYNRFSLERRLGVLIEDARRKSTSFGMIYVDLDDFKQVNDRFGHRVGDLYLQEAARRMKHQLRPTDLLARVGGDEFAALLPNVHSHAEVEDVALRLEHCFNAPFELCGHTLCGSASVGTALYPDDGETKDCLFSAADAAMYVSKKIKKETSQSVGRR
jgi:diguanylate cyclase (GGDEF)-like protein